MLKNLQQSNQSLYYHMFFKLNYSYYLRIIYIEDFDYYLKLKITNELTTKF